MGKTLPFILDILPIKRIMKDINIGLSIIEGRQHNGMKSYPSPVSTKKVQRSTYLIASKPKPS